MVRHSGSRGANATRAWFGEGGALSSNMVGDGRGQARSVAVVHRVIPGDVLLLRFDQGARDSSSRQQPP